MSSCKIIGVFNYKENGLTRQQEEKIAKKELESSPLDVNRWDFSRQMGTKKITGYNTFDVFEHGNYYTYKCKDCGCEFNLPHYKKTCLKCNGENLKIGQRFVGKCGMIKGVTGVYNGVHPELYKEAVKDLQEHPTPQASVEPNWEYLKENL